VTQLGSDDQDQPQEVEIPALELAPNAPEAVASGGSREIVTVSTDREAVGTVVREDSARPLTPLTSETSLLTPPAAIPAIRVQRTYELFGAEPGGGGKVPLLSALESGSRVLRAGMRIMVGDLPGDGFGLAGEPGRWHEYYGSRSPAEFGLDAERAVMYWAPDDAGGKGVALTADWLIDLLGTNWRVESCSYR
jgi:hypothetical protein